MGAEKNIPKKKTSTSLQALFDEDPWSTSSDNNGRKSCSESKNKEMLSLISYCTFVFTFTDPHESPSQQDLKRLKLLQILSTLKSSKTALNDQVLSSLMSMISTNLFRPLPFGNKPFITSDFLDDEELFKSQEPEWPHLQVIYDILLRIVINTNPKSLKTYIDCRFLLNLLELFQSEDPRERDSLTNVYHRIYSKFIFYRSFMRKSMNNAFLHFMFDKERHFGIGEMLEIWGSIINGFAIPLKEEHKVFFMKVLVPLHKPKEMQLYHRQLAYCVSQFVQKESVLGGVVVRGILKYWPITNCQKEVIFIEELEELVEIMDLGQYAKLALPLCTQLTKCLNSENSQVAERALFVWNNELFVKMTSLAMEQVFPIVVEGIEKNLKWHWSKSVGQITESVKMMLEEMEPILYKKCVDETEMRETTILEEEEKRRKKWERIEMEAAKNSQFIQPLQYVCL